MQFLVWLASGALVLTACARLPEQAPPRRPSALPTGATPPGAPRTPFARKTRAERMEFMGLYFFPRMKALFKKHATASRDPFRCQTCHGNDMEAVNYRMPNGLYTLPALPEGDPVQAARAYDEKTTAFMVDEVEPAAAALLGIDHVPGRSCSLCHGTE